MESYQIEVVVKELKLLEGLTDDCVFGTVPLDIWMYWSLRSSSELSAVLVMSTSTGESTFTDVLLNEAEV